MEKQISNSYFKVVITIKTENSKIKVESINNYTKLENALKDAKYITKTQGLETRVIYVTTTKYYYKKNEI